MVETRNCRRQNLFTFMWMVPDHVSSAHAQYGWESKMATPGLYLCPLCSSPSPTLKLYVSHLRVMHSKDPSFSILCGVGGCREVFRTFSAFNSHIIIQTSSH